MESTSFTGPGGTRPGDVAAVLAVKRLDEAKSRLAATRGPGRDVLHRALVLGMMLDTIEAVRGAGVDDVMVISPDDDVLRTARAAGTVGVREAIDQFSTGADRLNLAFTHATGIVRNRWPHARTVLLVQADLPAATARSLRAVLNTSVGLRQALLADRDGTGTTMLVRDVDITEPPRFGPDSAAAHRLAGAVELDPSHERWPDLRTDVDTAADLDAARSLGLGHHTDAALRGHPSASGLSPQTEHLRVTPDAS